MFLSTKEFAIGFLLVLATRLYLLVKSTLFGGLFWGTYAFIEILTLLYCLIFAYMSIEEKEPKKDE